MMQQRIKPTFASLTDRYDLFVEERVALLTQMAGVERHTINEMFLHHAVERQDAVKVLAALSRLVERTYTLENTDIALLDADPDEEGEA